MTLKRELHNPITEDEAGSLTEDEKVWLRNWNRAGEIPGEDGPEQLDPLDPNGVNKAAREALADSQDEYDDMDVDELKAELRSRELPVSGNKADLQARLRDDDASEEPSNPEE